MHHHWTNVWVYGPVCYSNVNPNLKGLGIADNKNGEIAKSECNCDEVNKVQNRSCDNNLIYDFVWTRMRTVLYTL